MVLCVQGKVVIKCAVHRTPTRTFLKTVLAEGIFKAAKHFDSAVVEIF